MNKIVGVVGLGYVGMPLAHAFASKGVTVIGFDTNDKKLEMYRNGIDPTNEIGSAVNKVNIKFTSDETELSKCDFIIVSVPTPVNHDNTPDLTPLTSASKIVGKNLKKNSIVVYESTVYPGVTEDVCMPILEKTSNLVCGKDFKIGYSPERINPGDKVHRLNTIKKIVSGMDEDTCDKIKTLYDLIIDAGTFKVSSIKTAESIKVVENSQRDINIAFMNEIAIILNLIGVNVHEVISGMNTKWNHLGFTPGLVGGHCISVDPYYLVHLAEQKGYDSRIILAGRQLNNDMSKYIVNETIKLLLKDNKPVSKMKIAVMGVTFKENCPDLRNSKVMDIINELQNFNIKPIIVDDVADKNELERVYGMNVSEKDSLYDIDCLILAVPHETYKKLDIKKIVNKNGVFIDIKGAYNKNEFKDTNIIYWTL